MNPPGGAPRATVLFVVTEDWYFMSHRYGLACRARDAGYRVAVATRVANHGDAIRAAGFALHPLPLVRALAHPLTDLRAMVALARVLRSVAPDLVHLVSLKPILLGGLLLALAPRGAQTLLAFTGLGYIFSSGARLARCLRPLVLRLIRCIARRAAWTIVQNADDRALLEQAGVLPPGRVSVIAGSGLALADYPLAPLPAGNRPLVLLPARVLRDKGVSEFVAAATLVRARRPAVRWVIVGAHDRDNPGAIAFAQLEAWLAAGAIEWWGHRDDMPAVYRQASVVCLPSYREGLPKALLEAAATGRPLVATDVPGCREVCIDGVTGLCVPPRDVPALAAALLRMLDEPDLAARCAQAAHAHVARHFSIEAIAGATLDLYAECLARASAQAC